MAEAIQDAVDKEAGAMKIVKKYTYWSAGMGVIPFPILDIGAVSAAMVKMLKDLSDYYDVDFQANTAKSVVSAVISSAGASMLAYGSVGSTLKTIPGAGTLFGMVSMPVFSGTTAYALGRFFVKHFDTGGTFFNIKVSQAVDASSGKDSE